jgi:hypothetical protein
VIEAMETQRATQAENHPPESGHGRTPCVRRRRHVRASGRTVALWAVCLYVVAQLPLLAVKDRWQSIGPLYESRKWPRLRQLVQSEPDRPLAIMLGSSRVCWAVQAGRLNGIRGPEGEPYLFYNFGIPATGAIHALLYLRDMIAGGIHPRLLLVEFVPPLLCEAHGTRASEEFFVPMAWTTRRDLLRLSPYLSRHGHQKVYEWFSARIVPWHFLRNLLVDDVRGHITGQPTRPAPKVDEWGACILGPPPPPEQRATDTAQTFDAYRAVLANYRLGVGPTKALRELLELSRREKMRVVFVVMPESSAFRGLYSAKAREETRELLASLVGEFRTDLIDANEWLDDEDFEDGQHVISAGAEAFTLRFYCELQSILSRPANADKQGSPLTPANTSILENRTEETARPAMSSHQS